MDLTQKSPENVAFMIEGIKGKLRVATMAAIKPSHFDYELYDDLHDIYEHVMGRPHFSVSEMDAIVTELGRLRKTDAGTQGIVTGIVGSTVLK